MWGWTMIYSDGLAASFQFFSLQIDGGCNGSLSKNISPMLALLETTDLSASLDIDFALLKSLIQHYL